MILSNSISSGHPDHHDPSLCNTQLFYDRDLELLRCDEEKACPYKSFYNKMTICDCPIGEN